MRISRDVVVKATLSALVLGKDVIAQVGGTSPGADTGLGPDAAETEPTRTGSGTTATATTSIPVQSAESTRTRPEASGRWHLLQNPFYIGEESRFDYIGRLATGLLDATSSGKEAGKGGDTLAVYLVQTSAERDQVVTTQNSWSVVRLFPCLNGSCNSTRDWEFSDDDDGSVPYGWKFETKDLSNFNSRNFFICMGLGTPSDLKCVWFSEYFDIERARPGLAGGDFRGQQNGRVSGSAPPAVPLPNATPLILTTQSSFLFYEGMPTTAQSTQVPEPTRTIMGVTVTAEPSSTTAQTISPSDPTTLVDTETRRGLSTGAIVGIVLGVLVLLSILAAIAIFFCLKRRRQARNGAQKHEQVMLTHAHGDNNSSDQFAEKDAVVTTLIHPSSNDTTFSHDSGARQTFIPAGVNRSHSIRDAPIDYHDTNETRDMQLSPYTSQNQQHTSSSIPFIAGAASNAPRRNPTNASQAPSAISALSRNTSTSTTASHQPSESTDYSHPLPHNALQNINEETASSTNVTPRYGDTRHTPTFHTGGDGGISIVQHGGVNSPGGTTGGGSYLHTSEPGMSQEEMARLEDEERRIDEAIAAAERAKGLR